MTHPAPHVPAPAAPANPSVQDLIRAHTPLTQNLCLECVRRDGLDLAHVPPAFRSISVLLAAVRQNAMCVQFFDADDWYGVNRSPESSSSERSPEFAQEVALIAATQNGNLLRLIPNELRNTNVVRAALEQDGWVLQYLQPEQINHDMLLTAVQQSGYALRFIAAADRTSELCLAAVLNAFPACVLLHLYDYIQPDSERLQALVLANWDEFVRIQGAAKAQDIRQAIESSASFVAAKLQTGEFTHLPRLTLNDLGVLPGTTLYLRNLVGSNETREVSFIGSALGRGLFIDFHDKNAAAAIQNNETYIVQGFTGQYSFSFLAHIVHAIDAPVACTILEYPMRVDSVRVRGSLRVKSDWPAFLLRPHQKLKNTFIEIPLRLHDLSLKGTRVVSDVYVGFIGQKIMLQIKALVHDELVDITLDAEVRHISQRNNDSRFYTGVQFGETTLAQKMAINYLMSMQAA
jgi:hypothetical protein